MIPLKLRFNELYDEYSNGDVNEKIKTKDENRLLYRVGTSEQTMHTISHSSLR